MSWLAALDSRMHEPQPALSPPEAADGPRWDLACDLDRRINKNIFTLSKRGKGYLLRKLLQEEQRAAHDATCLL